MCESISPWSKMTTGVIWVFRVGYRHWAVANEPSYILLDSCRVISVLTWHKCSTMLDTYILVVTVSPEEMFPQSWQASKTFVSGSFGVSSGLIRLISCVSPYLYEKALELILFHKEDDALLILFFSSSCLFFLHLLWRLFMTGVWGMPFLKFLQLVCFRVMGMNHEWPHSSGIVIGSWYFLLLDGCNCLSSQRTNLEAGNKWWTWISCKTDVRVLGQGAGPILVGKRKETSGTLMSFYTSLLF